MHTISNALDLPFPSFFMLLLGSKTKSQSKQMCLPFFIVHYPKKTKRRCAWQHTAFPNKEVSDFSASFHHLHLLKESMLATSTPTTKSRGLYIHIVGSWNNNCMHTSFYHRNRNYIPMESKLVEEEEDKPFSYATTFVTLVLRLLCKPTPWES